MRCIIIETGLLEVWFKCHYHHSNHLEQSVSDPSEMLALSNVGVSQRLLILSNIVFVNNVSLKQSKQFCIQLKVFASFG